METIGRNIAYFRRKAGLTQEELAEIMNVTAQAVSKWENDLSSPDLTSVRKLASVLDVSFEELFNGEDSLPIATDADMDRISRRILTIHVQMDSDESGSDKPINVTVRFPAAVVIRAYENGTLSELTGEDIPQLATAVAMIKEGVTGKIVDVQAGGTCVQITVDDYEH